MSQTTTPPTTHIDVFAGDIVLTESMPTLFKDTGFIDVHGYHNMGRI